MIPKRVSLENFLSYGTPKTDIVFGDDEPLWVLGGPNGVGKSAVFDAITYCLFAKHRGGGQGHDQLVRHGANGFSVSFEFEFAGTDYRVSRNRAGTRVTQSVERKTNGEWASVPNVDSAADVNAWAERTLGLSYSAFTASVLLPQGKSDELLEADPADRLSLLKKIIGAERYEELSGRVFNAMKGKKAALDALTRRRKDVSEVTAEDVAKAEAEVARTADVRETADYARRAAADAIPLARQWVNLCAKQDELTRRIREADARAADATTIRAGHARLCDLSAVLPVLQQLIPLRKSVNETTQRKTEAAVRHYSLVTELDRTRQQAEALRLTSSTSRQIATDLAAQVTAIKTEQGRREGFLKLADEVAGFREKVQAFAPDLDGVIASTRSDWEHTSVAERVASAAVSGASALLEQANRERDNFDRMEVGVTCRQCGQEVTASHAETVREQVRRRVAELKADMDGAHSKARAATAARVVLDDRLGELTKLATGRDRVRERLADRERDLTSLGATADAVAIRAELDTLAAQLTDLQRRQGEARDRQQAAEAELRDLEPTLRDLEKDARSAETEVARLTTSSAADSATRDSLTAQLPEPWRATTETALLVAEHDRLKAAGIAERFKELEQDAVRRDEWERQLTANADDIAGIAEPASVPVADAEQASRIAETDFRNRDGEYRIATTQRDDVTRRRNELIQLTADIAAAEAEHRVHGRLDELLGKQNLQRELIREAEGHIVRLASHTVGQLSGGDLSISLADPGDGDDRAFDLLVRRGDDPQPIGVKYLSGSQKFRVAIAVALAIGRFASGQARPLECVIIDEGFGGLDKDGLRAAAEELNRLKDHLRRIILVSHQEEFTDHFPVVIRLSKGEHGTTAEAVRQPR
ncbi:AAA family ATPase [Fimbriiglobus ruber]|uniref:DNA double-strand break repair Rad50 ATPase n=1 Tax=Fimbriiglobus ruber TaxID=1908690 RepID=A0A225DJE9_9BACT|nr:SMC family ATPase [Fimbriiglobus ruber]OWK37309.1 DNA double-strand break repair Rad50 ATPase [Fimbriiglobus ruber]